VSLVRSLHNVATKCEKGRNKSTRASTFEQAIERFSSDTSTAVGKLSLSCSLRTRRIWKNLPPGLGTFQHFQWLAFEMCSIAYF
jgi:hypothetical protein